MMSNDVPPDTTRDSSSQSNASPASPDCSGETITGPSDTACASRLVLVVDDNEETALLMGQQLEEDGYLIRIAYNVTHALAIIKTTRFDAAVLDIGLPDGTGYELAEQIRREAWGHEATLIAHTGWSAAEDIEQSRQAGFNHHLPKPLNYAELRSLLDA